MIAGISGIASAQTFVVGVASGVSTLSAARGLANFQNVFGFVKYF